METVSLILEDEGKIEVFIIRENKAEVIKFKGENCYIGKKEDFWREWEEKVGFINKEINEVDLCIIKSTDFNVGKNKYNTTKNTIWTIQEIKEFIQKTKGLVVEVNIDELPNIQINNKEFSIELHSRDIEELKNIYIKENDIKEKVKHQVKEISPIAKYYKEKTNMFEMNKKS